MTTLYLYGDRTPPFERLLAGPGLARLAGPLLATDGVSSARLPEDADQDLLTTFELACAVGVLRLHGDGYAPGPRLVPVPRQALEGLRELWSSPLEAYGAAAASAAGELRRTVLGLPVGRRHGWPALCHMVVAGCLLDLAVGALLAERGTVTSRPTGDTVLWAIARPAAANAFGIQQWRGRRSRAMLAQLWHRRTPARATRLADSMVDRLADLAAAGSGSGAARVESTAAPSHDLYLRHQGLLRRGDDGPELRVPDFSPGAVRRLAPPLFIGASRLVERGLAPALERLREHPWWSSRVDCDAHRHAAVRLLLEDGIDHALAAGALPPFPAAPSDPAGWGRCLWREPKGLETSLIPGWATAPGQPTWRNAA